MVPLYHRGGIDPCGKVALFVRLLQGRYELTASNVRKVDGTQPVRGEGIICGACGLPVVPPWLFPDPGPAVVVSLPKVLTCA